MSDTFSGLFRDFRSFLEYPQRDILREKISFGRFGQIVGLHYLILISVVLIMSALSGIIGIDQLEHSVEDLLADSSMMWFLFLLVIAAPVLEEIFFRYPLRFKRGSLFILTFIASLLAYYIGTSYLPDMNDLIPAENLSELEATGQEVNLGAVMLAMVTFTLGLIGIFIVSLSKELLNWSSGFVKSLFPYIFFLTAMIFGFVHFANFAGDMKWFWIPILVLPQFGMGLLLGYIRLRYGMISNILLHAVNNLVPAVFMLTVSQMRIG